MGAQDAQLKLQSGQGQLSAGQTLAGINQQQIQDLMNTGNVARVVQQSQDNFNYGQFLENRDWNVNNLTPLLQTLSSIPKNQYQNMTSDQVATTVQKSGGAMQIIGAAAAIAGAFFTGGASLAIGAGLTAAAAGMSSGSSSGFGDQNVAASGSGTSWNGAFGNMADSINNNLAIPTPKTAFGP
jgi:hypothetical protein